MPDPRNATAAQLTIDVARSEIVALLGPNGVGKTAILRAVMGLSRDPAVRITLDDRDVSDFSADAIARAGVGYVPRDADLFRSLTVVENLALATRIGEIPATRKDWLCRVFPTLSPLWRRRAATLAAGERRLVAIARALAEPRHIFVMDSPTAGLSGPEVAALAGVMRDMRLQGAAMLIADTDLRLAGEVADRAVVMVPPDGIVSGDLSRVLADARVARLLRDTTVA